LAEWQNNELAGITDIVYIVASHADVNGDSVEPSEMAAWETELGFTADELVIDDNRDLMDTYMDANPGPQYTQAVTVIVDKNMEIQKVGGTYDTDHDENLQLLLDLAAE
jgi:hypothetical protein